MLKEKKIKLCFIGNPNVGKSTLINRLLNSNELQISKNPGTTKTIIEKNLIRNEKEFILLDTAGVYKKKNFNFDLLIKATRFSEIVVLILDSSIDKLDKIHKKLVSHTLKVGKGLIIIFNKWDLIKNKKNKKKELEKFVRNSLPQIDEKKLLFISALRDAKFTKIFELSIEIQKLLKSTMPTSNLNKWLRDTIKHNPPIRIRGKEIKFKYIVQIRTNPPTFKIFSNHPNKINSSYKRFLEKRLKLNYKIDNIPVFLKFLTTKNPYQEKKK